MSGLAMIAWMQQHNDCALRNGIFEMQYHKTDPWGGRFEERVFEHRHTPWWGMTSNNVIHMSMYGVTGWSPV